MPGEFFYIKSHLTGFVLDIQGGNQSNGAKVAPYPKNSTPSDNQLWYLEYQLDGTFLVVSKMNGKVLDCGAQGQGHQLIVWDRHGGENQRFRMEGNYLVTMRGLVLDIAGANPAPCAPLCLWSRNNPPSANQQFQLEPAEKHNVYIQTHLNGFVLDIQGCSQANGAKVVTFPMNSPPSPNQLWHLDYQPDGTFFIVSKLNGKVLDCGGQGQGQQLCVWDRHGGENQRWRREGNHLVTIRGLVVDIPGANPAPGVPLTLWGKNHPHSSNQLFSIISPAVHISSHLHGMVLDIQGGDHSNGATVKPYPRKDAASPNQLWHLDYQPDGTFLIVSKMNGKVLDAGNQAQAQQLIVWDRHGGENQRWRRQGHYFVTMRGLVWDISGSNTAPCAPLVLWTKNHPGSQNQHFDVQFA
eukprot:Em0020g746a